MSVRLCDTSYFFTVSKLLSSVLNYIFSYKLALFTAKLRIFSTLSIKLTRNTPVFVICSIGYTSPQDNQSLWSEKNLQEEEIIWLFHQNVDLPLGNNCQTSTVDSCDMLRHYMLVGAISFGPSDFSDTN